MSRKISDNEQAAALIAGIFEVAAQQRPRLTAAEMARRAGVRPETVSRMKRSGRGDLGTVVRLAAVVGKKLALEDVGRLPEKARAGEFFDAN